jgi:hypothetical protein
VPASGEQLQTTAHRLLVVRLGQNPPSAGNNRVRADDEITARRAGNGCCFGTGEASGNRAWHFAAQRCFVNVCGNNAVRLDANLTKEREPAR